MGMYSYFDSEDLTIKDWEGLVSFIELWKTEISTWIDSGDYKMLDLEAKTFTFKNWDDIKLISYWYNETLAFLKNIADYVEGEVHWDFENDDEAGWIEFIDGKCIIHTRQTQWQESNPEDLFREDEDGFYGEDKHKPNQLKKFMIVGSI